jgi:hypothetical protein
VTAFPVEVVESGVISSAEINSVGPGKRGTVEYLSTNLLVDIMWLIGNSMIRADRECVMPRRSEASPSIAAASNLHPAAPLPPACDRPHTTGG